MNWRRLSLKQMAEWCRTLSSGLNAGMSLSDTFRLAGKRSRPELKALSNRIDGRLREGSDLSSSLEAEGDIFPPLFLAMAHVAGETGQLPETIRRLEDYFWFRVRLQRDFRQQIFWPVMQLVMAIFIIAGLIYILGIIAGNQPGGPMDVLGLGLTGTAGAVTWLSCWFGLLVVGTISYIAGREIFRTSGLIDRVLLRLPILGHCLKLLALARLAFALRLTMDSGMSVLDALAMSLDATENGAYTTLKKAILADVREGDSIHDALSRHSSVFTEEFLEVALTGENTGTMPESMGRLSTMLNEQAEHQMALLNSAVGWLVWMLVAGLIIFLIFRIFSSYINTLNDAVKGFN